MSDNSPGGCRSPDRENDLLATFSLDSTITQSLVDPYTNIHFQAVMRIFFFNANKQRHSADYGGTASLGLHKYQDRSRAMRC